MTLNQFLQANLYFSSWIAIVEDEDDVGTFYDAYILNIFRIRLKVRYIKIFSLKCAFIDKSLIYFYWTVMTMTTASTTTTAITSQCALPYNRPLSTTPIGQVFLFSFFYSTNK